MKKFFIHFHGVGLKLFVILSFLVVLVFSIIIYINTEFYTNHIENNIRNHVTQLSDLIKRTTYSSMLKNQKEDLALIISNVGQERYIERIRIYNKRGVIKFSDHPGDINQPVDLKQEQCGYCHNNNTFGTMPDKNRFFESYVNGERILELINPIKNEPACYNASCHVHKKEDMLLGLIDFKLSLKELDKSASETKRKALLFSLLLIILATAANGLFIRSKFQRPLSKLMDGIHQVTDLNLDYTLDASAADEIGDVAKSFNLMTKKLKNAHEELQEWSNTLEDKVNEKTEELEKAQKQMILSEKMASMGKLATIVAHEINNPMSGILIYSKLLEKNLKNNPTRKIISESIKDIKMIQDESKRCGDIVKNLLLFSKKSFGERSYIDLKSIINKSVELVRHKFKIKEIELIKNYSKDDTDLFCDSAAIQQIVIALLINALEAFPHKGGKVKIGLYRDDLNKQFQLKISDNAIGIPEEVIPRIFEPFYTTKEWEKNT